MRLIRPTRSTAWRRSAALLACMAFSSGVWAQQYGFFVYPATGKTYGSEMLVAECAPYDAKKGGTQSVSCKFSKGTEVKITSYTATQPPEAILFTSVAVGCWCRIVGGSVVCVPPSCGAAAMTK